MGENDDRTEDQQPESGSENETQAKAEQVSVESLIAERDKYLEMARRVRADFDNYQKRVARDMQTERQYAAQPLIAALLPVVDNLDRALESASAQKGSDGGIIEGVSLVRKQLQDAFEKHGVRAIAPEGDPFDPNVHEAVMQVPTNAQAPMTVIRTVQTGYMLHDRVIRPAQVIVAAAMPSAGGE